MTEARPGAHAALVIPSFVPPAVTAIAQTVIADAFAGPFPKYANATMRLTTDPRMKQVWEEVFRQHRLPDRSYVNAAQERSVKAWPCFPEIRDLIQSVNSRETLQNQAAALLFLEATRFFLWDQRHSYGPRAITVAEVAEQVHPIKELAKRILLDCEGLKELGLWQHVSDFEQAVGSLDVLALTFGHPSDPYIVERKSSRIGNDWERGFLITMGSTCHRLFGNDMIRTVRTLGNVALDRSDLTVGKVRGALRAPNERRKAWLKAASNQAP